MADRRIDVRRQVRGRGGDQGQRKGARGHDRPRRTRSNDHQAFHGPFPCHSCALVTPDGSKVHGGHPRAAAGVDQLPLTGLEWTGRRRTGGRPESSLVIGPSTLGKRSWSRRSNVTGWPIEGVMWIGGGCRAAAGRAGGGATSDNSTASVRGT